MNWHPHNLFHCFDSDPLAWLTIVLCVGVVLWYLMITWFTWMPACKGASKGAARSMRLMAAIFVFCALAGYSTRVVSSFSPKIAYCLLAVSLVLLNVACPMFLLSQANQDFKAIGKRESVGSEILAQYSDSKNDQEMASMTRRIVRDSLHLVALSRNPDNSPATIAISEATILADAMLSTAKDAADAILALAKINADKLLAAAAAAAAAAAEKNTDTK